MIRVLSGGAVQTFVRPLASSFADDMVEVEFQPMGKLVKTLADGYAADVVIVTEEVLARLKLKGTPVARVGVGVGVRESAPLPDLSTVEAFKRALLAAKSVIYMDPQIGTSGKHVAEVLQRLEHPGRGQREGQTGPGRAGGRGGGERRDRARHPPDQRDPSREGGALCRPAAVRAAGNSPSMSRHGCFRRRPVARPPGSSSTSPARRRAAAWRGRDALPPQ